VGCELAHKPAAGRRAAGQDPELDDPLDGACTLTGSSVIECQNQILGEAVVV
jgi:hypothetical protein